MTILLFYLLYISIVTGAENYDYIIVGSGSAGSVVANRLSKDPNIQVLLLEAGSTPTLIADVPFLGENQRTSPVSWNYKTVPLKYAGFGLNNRVSLVPRGKVLGGTSTIHEHLYIRGNRNDYDTWAAQGATGWGWKEVFPYFVKHEDNGNPAIVANGYHGVGGEQPVNYAPFYAPITLAYLKSAEYLGYRIGDYNGRNQTVFMPPQGTIKEGRRWAGLKSFLEPIRGRRNLRVLTSAFVLKILIDDKKRACGVLFERYGKIYKALANEEVVLCAGTFNSAKLLMLSGIGPKDQLKKLHIPVISDLPVGKNLQDHITTFGLLFTAKTYTFRLGRLTILDFMKYLLLGIGPLSSLAAVETIGYIKSIYEHSEFPDLEILWRSVPAAQNKLQIMTLYNVNEAMWEVLKPYSQSDVVHCHPFNLHPKSTGKMWLASADPYDPPLIDPNYYSRIDDLKVMVEGMKFCLKMALQIPMKLKGVNPIPLNVPGCEPHVPFSDQYLACVARVASVSFDHFVGTCKMGNPDDPTTVVDPFLRVKGIHSLRVVDASIMPTITSGHTHAPTAMIGEKGSEIILQDLCRRKKQCKQ